MDRGWRCVGSPGLAHAKCSLPTPDPTCTLSCHVRELGVDGHASLVISELRNPGGEPRAITAAANQKHRARAFRRRRIQRVVDAKIAIRFERNTREGCAALDKRSRGFTKHRGKDALVGVLPDGIAAGQEQTAPSDLNTAVGVEVASEIGDPPGLTDGFTTNIWALSTTTAPVALPISATARRFIVRRVSWSSDGRAILAAVAEGDSDIVMLEGLTNVGRE
jgi:hypothetical protein